LINELFISGKLTENDISHLTKKKDDDDEDEDDLFNSFADKLKKNSKEEKIKQMRR